MTRNISAIAQRSTPQNAPALAVNAIGVDAFAAARYHSQRVVVRPFVAAGISTYESHRTLANADPPMEIPPAGRER
jgi:hypothetical protein